MKGLRGILMVLVVALLAAALVGCGGCSVPEVYVKADRQLYEVVAPEYLRYVKADGSLSLQQVQDRVDLMAAWEFRIRQAEGGAR